MGLSILVAVRDAAPRCMAGGVGCLGGVARARVRSLGCTPSPHSSQRRSRSLPASDLFDTTRALAPSRDSSGIVDLSSRSETRRRRGAWQAGGAVLALALSSRRSLGRHHHRQAVVRVVRCVCICVLGARCARTFGGRRSRCAAAWLLGGVVSLASALTCSSCLVGLRMLASPVASIVRVVCGGT